MSLPLQDCFGAPWYHLGSVGVIHTFLVWASLFYKSSPDLLTLDSPLCLDSPLASLSDSLHLHLFRSLFLSLSCSSYLPSLLSYPLLSSPLLSLSLSLLLVTHLSAYAPLALSLSLALSLTLSSFSLFPPLSHSLSLCTLDPPPRLGDHAISSSESRSFSLDNSTPSRTCISQSRPTGRRGNI